MRKRERERERERTKKPRDRTRQSETEKDTHRGREREREREGESCRVTFSFNEKDLCQMIQNSLIIFIKRTKSNRTYCHVSQILQKNSPRGKYPQNKMTVISP